MWGEVWREVASLSLSLSLSLSDLSSCVVDAIIVFIKHISGA